ncbi:MAG: hypothetical protein LBD59_10370 [Prevotellaceae bacterium]|jgi:hypothetical protein|nr:hypothetical protein [Prevotellaceae bacterium]
MKRIFIAAFILLTCRLAAQENYLYPQFMNAQVYYKNEAISAFVNYNLFTSEILMIEKGKKRRLPDVDRIDYVSIGADRFIALSDNTFGKIVADGGLILALRYSGNVVRTNETDKGLSKSAVNKLLESGKPLPAGVEIATDSAYYFLKQRTGNALFYLPGTNVEKASYAGVTKLFAKHKARIDAFIESKNIDFSSPESLKRLAAFCDELMEE